MKTIVSWRLPADLPDEATALASGDYLVIQKSGATTLRRLPPSAMLGTANPQALGSATAGTSLRMARNDHVHPTTGLLPTSGGTLTGALTARNITPDTDNTRDLGSPSLRYAEIYAVDLQAGGGTLTGTLTTRSLIPSANTTYTLGQSGTSWHSAFITSCYSNNYLFISDNDTGMQWSGTGVGLYRNNTLIANVTTTGVMPGLDETYDLGTAANAWNNIFYQTATDVSDQELKTDITDGDLGLDFIDALRPVKFRWRNGGLTTSGEQDKDGNPIYTTRPGVRVHYGLVADEVKAALGEKDFGGYVEDAESGRKGLRYSQIVSVLIKAVQELHGQVKEDRQARLALEQRLAELEKALARIGGNQA